MAAKTFSSSPELSSPPSDFSDPGSPSRLAQGRANIAQTGDEIIVDTAARFGLIPQQNSGQPQPPYPEGVKLTKDGVPRKKPGRKPGTAVKPRASTDSTTNPASATTTTTTTPAAADAPKVRRPRKPRDPNLPPIQRKRKVPPTATTTTDDDTSSFTLAPARQERPAQQQQQQQPPPPPPPPPPSTTTTELTSMRMDIDPPPRRQQSAAPAEPVVKRESMPGSMQNILNADPPPQPSPPVRSSGQSYDPIRSTTTSSYDPVRETMLTRDPYGTGPLGSPRAPTQMTNRASASPSIASLVDPPVSHLRSPSASQQGYAGNNNNNSNTAGQSRFPDTGSLPPSPSTAVRAAVSQAAASSSSSSSSKPAATTEAKRPPPPPPVPAAITKNPEPPTTKPAAAAAAAAAAPAPTVVAPPLKDVTMTGTVAAAAPTKKVASMVQQERKKQKSVSTTSSPKISGVKDAPLPAVPDMPSSGNERSILDFGKAKPGEESAAPSIVLHIPLNGETNKYVNFTRLAEEKYGWDALHPRLAAIRDRKARIAAASAALEKTGSGRESGDEMSMDDQSGDENSHGEGGGANGGGGGTNGGGGATSGPDAAPAKQPAKKKRNFREDEYDKEDDFVDDSELMWEEQAAASRDGFFVYSGPLVPEDEKPKAGTDGPPRRGRGGRGRGGTTRGGASGRGTGRGGGPGSRGGSVTRKPRMTKLEKAQREMEKQERERNGQMASKTATSSAYNVVPGTNPPFAAGMVVDIA